jgi:transcriptional regulator with XRE-family HTH domain
MSANLQELYLIKNRILGTLILEARNSAGLSIDQCAALLGLDAQQYTDFEAGNHSPSLPQLEILSFAFDVPLKHFWGTETLSASSRADEIKDRVPEMLMLRQKMIGLRLRQLREEAGLSLDNLAEKSGTDSGKLAAVEAGEITLPVSELEVITRAFRASLDDLTDPHGPVGNWIQAQEEFKSFQQMPADLRAFVLRPINRSYIDLAVRLSNMQVEQLRTIAESILEITF